MTKKTETFRTKLGTARRVERSRIWIEGKRLVAAGFTVGSYFAKTWQTPDPLSTTQFETQLTLKLLKANDVLATAPCKVSGKGEKPIIDITGEAVRELFGRLGSHVDVVYFKGKIVITPAANS